MAKRWLKTYRISLLGLAACGGLLLASIPGRTVLAGNKPSLQTRLDGIEKKLSALDLRQENAAKIGRLREKKGDTLRELGRPKSAAAIYRKAMAAYAAAGETRRRDRLVRRLSKKSEKWPAAYARRFKRLEDAWQTVKKIVKKARRWPRKNEPPDEIRPEIFEWMQAATKITALARKTRNRELRAWGLQAEAILAGVSGYPDDELEKYALAAAACEKGACRQKRAGLLRTAARINEKAKQWSDAYTLYAQANAIETRNLKKAKRRYARSKSLIRVCAQLRKIPNSVSCLKLEQQATGFVTFHDFSSARKRQKLSKAEIHGVHKEYLALLTKCLFDATKRGEIQRGEQFVLDWAVSNEGRAVRFEFKPSQTGSELGRCFSTAMQLFRYPRYRGERRTITLPLAVDLN